MTETVTDSPSDPAPPATAVDGSVAGRHAAPTTTGTANALPKAACDHYSKSVDRQSWWDAHYTDAADAVIEFLAGDGISLKGRTVADIGCGDGIIDLALARKGAPAKLVGFDLMDTDVDELAARAAEQDIDGLPENLYFATSGPDRIPAEDGTFDLVVSWSAFEHILDLDGMLAEIHRVMAPTGVLFIQLWPFYATAHGSHLVDWFPDGFAQYEHDDDEITRIVRASGGDQAMASEMLGIYRTLNEITVDDLGEALRRNHFRVAKLSLDAGAVHIPTSAAHVPLSHVGVTGVTLLASRQPAPPPIPEPEPEPEPEPVPEPPAPTGVVPALRGLLRRADAALSRWERP